MPVYVCQSGSHSDEPWRHGIQVYAEPFNIDAEERPETLFDGGNDLVVGVDTSETKNDLNAKVDRVAHHEHEQHHYLHGHGHVRVATGHPIRRVRHSEVVLVDDVCVAYNRYWLRLRWPGHRGGFAGYIAMGHADSSIKIRNNETNTTNDEKPMKEPSSTTESLHSSAMTCSRTSLPFQTSELMELLALYDDGIRPRVTMAPYPTEEIHCRFCKEGIHEDADADQPNLETKDKNLNMKRDPSSDDLANFEKSVDHDDENDNDNDEDTNSVVPADASSKTSIGPIEPTPSYHIHHDALQNPMLAPCECAGSMAFVHYLCVEQWRCRSKHPDAKDGLNCETCSSPYGLPPPSSRPDPALEQEDWLEAMPPHVMQALRNPHYGWQIGAAVVNRKWLRPLAPTLVSPIVALYCRARRLLKKRGVARRRWACSLCRRRARWKCVRCLRSYYCSRQCQNVSWHIIHKHVCFKPTRFWLSVAVYNAIVLTLFPGIIRDPILYDIGVCMIGASFFTLSILIGGIATIIKELNGKDIRGRLLELLVTVLTVWMSVISWGLVKGFFGNVSACYGNFGSYGITKEDLAASHFSLLRMTHEVVLKPNEIIYITVDNMFSTTFPLLRNIFCTRHSTEENGCFEHLPNVNADFFLTENQGEKCASDLSSIVLVYILAGLVHGGIALKKNFDHHRRRQIRQTLQIRQLPRIGQVVQEPRPHQD